MSIDPKDTSSVRRQLHKYPETAFLEIITASFIWEKLSALGWSLRAGQRLLNLENYAGLPEVEKIEESIVEAKNYGVSDKDIARFRGGATTIIADLEGTKPGPKIGLRFDMDALPITEDETDDHFPQSSGFLSQHLGRMHACGHDGHVAIGLRLAALLSENQDFSGSVRLIFQPAEEGVRGAAPIVNAGLCDDLDIFLAMHIGFGAPKDGVGYATKLFGTSKFKTIFTGKAAHASNNPEYGRNSLLAASQAVLALHSIPRFSNSQTRVNVGHLVSEGASNVIPEQTTMLSEVRASTRDAHVNLEERAQHIFDGAAISHGVQSATVRTGYAVPADTCIELYKSIAANCHNHGFKEIGEHAMYASDDATLMMQRVTKRGGRACYLVLGAGDYGPHHTSRFDFDEDVLPRASDLIEQYVRSFD